MLSRFCPLVYRATCSTLFRLQPVIKCNLPSVQSLSFEATKRFCSNNKTGTIGIVDYSVVKEIQNHPEKLLIDVRDPDELKETGQIPSSINIPVADVGKELCISDKQFRLKYGREKPNANTEIIFHCKIGRRSLKAAEAASALGFTNVKSYEGSWTDWAKREGLPK
ncbi:rhodanese domain-containing protein CG4456 [Drosophila busckii]|uniref:rhodanese domain-containing protein CG4456 n=1 Tax=Drosophila busckii TaxID=30019 RepID=UPI00083EAFB0|nr:rhodanese domain-containing protein CG4456 [Drosophila busckii]